MGNRDVIELTLALVQARLFLPNEGRIEIQLALMEALVALFGEKQANEYRLSSTDVSKVACYRFFLESLWVGEATKYFSIGHWLDPAKRRHKLR